MLTDGSMQEKKISNILAIGFYLGSRTVRCGFSSLFLQQNLNLPFIFLFLFYQTCQLVSFINNLHHHHCTIHHHQVRT